MKVHTLRLSTLPGMAKTIKIGLGDGATVRGRYAAAPGRTGVLLAHGAGVGQDSDWIIGVRDGLAAAGIPVLTFDYPYMDAGKRAPNRSPVLIATHRAALKKLRARVDRVVIAGKSMGGRIGSHLVAEGEDVHGLVFYGYPLVAVGKTEPRDTSHLSKVEAPMLFIQGTRDRLAPVDLIGTVVSGLPEATLHVVEDGDHSFRVPKRAGRDQASVMAEVVEVSAGWIHAL